MRKSTRFIKKLKNYCEINIIEQNLIILFHLLKYLIYIFIDRLNNKYE
jgi:hypothetical protein